MYMKSNAELILNSTIKLLIKVGAKKISMDDIAEYAHMSKVTVYKYFKDKSTLYFQVSNYIYLLYITKLEQVAESKKALTDKLSDFLEIINDFSASGQFSLCEELAQFIPEAENDRKRYQKVYYQTMISLIDDGLSAGMLRNDLSKDVIFYYIDMSVIYYQQNSAYRDKMRHDNDFQQRFLSFFINNIFVDGAGVY